MELQHFSHNHPLVFHEEQCHGSDQKAHCSGCWELVSGPSFSCVECGYHLDKSCAEAPSQIKHPFHRSHMLDLLASSTKDGGRPSCNLCGKECDNFMYHCSCNLNLHIKCALFSFNIANIDVEDLQICRKYPRKKANCFLCQKPLSGFVYLSPDSKFYLHEKCVEQPLEITHRSHRQHPLFLQFVTTNILPVCNMCQETQQEGLVYCCSICKFFLHMECLSPPRVISDMSCHKHPFYRCFRQISFNCDACGTIGDCVSYICATCSLVVHKKCTSLPRFISTMWHHHPMSHKYFVVDNECGLRRCIFCHEVVDKNYGSYNCSICNCFFHVNCALHEPSWYKEIESRDDYKKLHRKLKDVDVFEPSFSVIRGTKVGDEVVNIEIKHFSHQHNLLLSDEVKIDRYCDGCSLLILSSFYHCSQCDFCLNKSCAELTRKKQVRFHDVGEHTQHLLSNCTFQCADCEFDHHGFAYECKECSEYICPFCAEFSLTCSSQGHQHILLYYYEYNGQLCNACGETTDDYKGVYRCMDCNYNVHRSCTLLPPIVHNKCDQHNLTLTYYEDNDHSESHYCDICERERNPNTWFYHCTICDTSTHLKCATGDYPFIMPGIRIHKVSIHSHSLVFVKNAYQYSAECWKCHEPCLDSALECEKKGCNYMIHWECARSFIL